MIAGPGEAIVGRGLLDALGLHVGDRLPLEAEGARLDLRIVGRYVEPDNDGRTAIFDRRSVPPAALARFGPVQYELQLHRPLATRTPCRPRWCAPRAGSSTSR